MSAININNIKPIGTHILVRKCQRGDAGLIITPDSYKEETSMVEILAVGNKCKVFNSSHIGKITKCPEMAEGMHNLEEGRSEYWMVKENVLDPIVIEL